MSRQFKFGPAILAMNDHLDPAEAVHVPDWDDKYHFQEASLENIALCVEQDIPVLLTGPTGCGKSTLVQALAAIVNQPTRRVNLHGDVRSVDFLGQKVIDTDENGNSVVVWKDGVLPDAMRKGHWLILDEFDAAPASIAMVLQAVLEPGHTLVLSANHGEVVRPHENFRIFATANTIGRGDDSGLYAGTNVLNEATLDRFVVEACDYPEPVIETRIVMEKAGIEKALAEQLVKAAVLVRKGYDNEECFCTFSTRRLIAWASVAARFTTVTDGKQALSRAYKLTVDSKLGKEDAEYVRGVVGRVLDL